MFAKRFMILLQMLALSFAAGCSSTAPSNAKNNVQTAAAPEKGGAQLWAENCSRCHNIRPPQSFNDAQWHAVVHHMRLRANLTGEEARLVTEFLQANH